MNEPLADLNRQKLLTRELAESVRKALSPIALKYGYSNTSLDQLIKWKPIVLLLGNYSSGKSSLINELLGTAIQETGQAPTDDSFTIITHKAGISGWEEIEGTAVISDHQLPFQHLSKFGERFSAHFKLKTIDVPFLQEVALIDTPGMLDSISEKDRGYDYQAVVSELATLADLIVVMFDPHRPGTVRETHELLRKTLPTVSYENRTLFVLNRIDECDNLNDLLRTYGTLCWNLSQMTGRKDIPKIFLSFRELAHGEAGFLSMLSNQRTAVKQLILDAPKHRLEHLVSFTESHGRHLLYFLQVLERYGQQRRAAQAKGIGLGMAAGIGLALFTGLLFYLNVIPSVEGDIVLWISICLASIAAVAWVVFVQARIMKRFHESMIQCLEDLATFDTQSEGDSWLKVRRELESYLETRRGRFSLLSVQNDLRKIRNFRSRILTETRTALSTF